MRSQVLLYRDSLLTRFLTLSLRIPRPCFFAAVPVATILGPSEIYLDAGSTINITCVIQHTPVPTPNVNWLHQDEVMAPDYNVSQLEMVLVLTVNNITSSSLL